MEPLTAAVDPHDVSLDIAYVADPWGGKLELIEWTGLWHSLPGPPRAEGVNHVAFGVKDVARSRVLRAARVHRAAVRVDRLLRADGAVVPVRAARPAHDHDAVVAGRRHRAGRLDPRGPDCRGEWGHIGPFEFAVGVASLERGLDALRAMGARRESP